MPKGKQKASSLKKHRQIPYAKGFKPPSTDKCLSAISYPSLSLSDLPKYLQPSRDSFLPLPRPTSIDDWLAQYKEPGQTFTEFISDTPWLSSRKWIRGTGCEFNSSGTSITERYIGSAIYLIPLGDFESDDTRLAPKFSDLVNYVEIFYNIPVKLMDNVKMEFERNSVYLRPTSSTSLSSSSAGSSFLLESRHNSKTHHRQLKVSSILIALKKMMPRDALFVVALTMEDLYDDKPDLFVAGMAAGNHRVGVFSFSRYDPTCTFSPENWFDIKRKKCAKAGKKVEENKRLILQRSCKLLVHELAHLLGLDHCIWFDCCMNGSGHLMEDYKQSMFLCPVDLNKLQTLCSFDVVERYQKMKEYFKKHKMDDERQWVERRLSEIKS